MGKTIINNQHLGMVNILYHQTKNSDDWGPLGDGLLMFIRHLPSFTHIAALQGRSVAFPAPHALV